MSTELNSGTVGGFGHMGPNDPYNDGHSGSGSSGGSFKTLYTILCKCLFSEVTVQAVTELDNKAAHCHTPVPQRHRPFL